MASAVYRCKIGLMNAARRALGDRLVMEQYRRRSARKYRRAGIVFIHIPKAAGTSVCDSLYGGRVGHFTLSELRHPPGRSTAPSGIEGLPSFSVVRDPLERLHSSYRYARDGGGTKGGINPDPAYRSTRFRSFGAFLEEWLVHQELTSLDRVFWPQSRFVDDAADGAVDFVGKVEDMGGVQRWLRRNVSGDIAIPHLNRARRASDAPSYRAEDRRIVRELYGEDYETFGYA